MAKAKERTGDMCISITMFSASSVLFTAGNSQKRTGFQKYNRTFGTDLDITPHVFRHTFCTKMAMSGMNPKVLQYIMGHGDISVTMNTYTHVNYDNAKEEMEKLFGKK